MDEIRRIDSDFEYMISAKFQDFKGKAIDELGKELCVSINSKSSLELICARILNIHGKVNLNSEFIERNIVLKTVRVEGNGSIKESMSFPSFKFTEIIKENWNDSQLRKTFASTRFLFVVFAKKDQLILDRILFWSMPASILDTSVKEIFEKTKAIIKEGEIVSCVKENKNGTLVVKSNFPGMHYNGVCHVRPHARNSEDTFPLPVIDKKTGLASFTKQCFWLNSSFIKKVVS